MMGLAKRIIPCLDVDRGRVVKGVKFVNIRDAGDPVEIARRYDAQGADEITFLDITASSDDRETMVHVVEQVASAGVHPADRGRRHPHPGRRAADAERRGRQGVHQYRRDRQSGVRARGGRALRFAVHRGGDRRQSASSAGRKAGAGKSSPTAAAGRPGSTPWPGRGGWRPTAPGKSC
jgi:hypothetical protein